MDIDTHSKSLQGNHIIIHLLSGRRKFLLLWRSRNEVATENVIDKNRGLTFQCRAISGNRGRRIWSSPLRNYSRIMDEMRHENRTLEECFTRPIDNGFRIILTKDIEDQLS